VDTRTDTDPQHPSSLPEPGRNCWRVETADRAALIIDAADYFAVAQKALKNARRQVLLIGWDFDTRICLDGQAGPKSATLGQFILRLAKERPDLDIRILKWNLGALKVLARGSMIFTVLRWMRHRRIKLKLDSAHPVGASHHQKLIVVDDAFAFCGGIDMTSARWDTREHLDDDPRRKGPDGSISGPWHDMTLAVDGSAAKALGQVARDRWQRATGKKLQAKPSESDPWPQGLEPTFRQVSVAIARTRAEHNGCGEIRENEALFVDMINSARSFIYAENQYFASRVIAEAIARRMQEENPPEFVLVMPETADGWLEQVAMDTARSNMMTMIAKVDHKRRFRVYSPVTAAGEPIYVHAKLTIVDDEVIRVGSSNMNNRSLGLDSECDLCIDARLSDRQKVSSTIAAIRQSLIAEHLGCAPERIEAALSGGSLIAAIEQLRGSGRSLRPVTPDEHSAAANYLAEEGTLDPGDENAPDYEAMTRKRWRFRKR
jgi:phosphatidylserine/phosphatidylglycerophosphate/cardiolipin synthase-like enzyme